jgi:transposase
MRHARACRIAHKSLIAAYHVLAGNEYQELGTDYLDSLNKKRTVNQLTRHLQAMGYNVQITPKAA